MAKQTGAERLFTLTCCLVAAPRLGISKQQLLQSVAGYADNESDEARNRTFERDKALLRAAGIQLEVIDVDGAGDPESFKYRIARGVFGWPDGFELNSQKLQLIELAGRAWNQQAMKEQAQSAITRLKALGYVQSDHELDVFSPRILARHESFRPLAQAISEGLQVEFDYQKAGFGPETRSLSPGKLRFIEGEWVLLAKDRGQLKNFLLRRIVSEVKISTIQAEQISEAEISEAERSLAELVESQKAVLVLEPETECWWHFGAPESGSVTVNYMDPELLLEDLIEFGADFKVQSPQALIDLHRETLQKVVNTHA